MYVRGLLTEYLMAVLIEAKWNVNEKIKNGLASGKMVLIEAKWAWDIIGIQREKLDK